jgi:hypothetical protein
LCFFAVAFVVEDGAVVVVVVYVGVVRCWDADFGGALRFTGAGSGLGVEALAAATGALAISTSASIASARRRRRGAALSLLVRARSG